MCWKYIKYIMSLAFIYLVMRQYFPIVAQKVKPGFLATLSVKSEKYSLVDRLNKMHASKTFLSLFLGLRLRFALVIMFDFMILSCLVHVAQLDLFVCNSLLDLSCIKSIILGGSDLRSYLIIYGSLINYYYISGYDFDLYFKITFKNIFIYACS